MGKRGEALSPFEGGDGSLSLKAEPRPDEQAHPYHGREQALAVREVTDCYEFAFGGRALKPPLDRIGWGRKGVDSFFF